MNINDIRRKLEQKKGQRNQVAKDLKQATSEKNRLEKEARYSEKAQAIIQAVAQQTQNELEYRITEPVSLALSAIWSDPYKQVAEFKITGRGTTECHLGFERGGIVTKPLYSSGGGPIDVAAFALRMSAWSLSQPRSRNVLFLDEPFRFVSKKRLPAAGQMLKEAAKELNLQIVMISHISELIDSADKVFELGKDREGATTIQEG